MHRAEAAVGIVGIGSYVPERVVANVELERRLDLPAGWIEERTGVLERRVAAEDQATSDLAVEAASRALSRARMDARDIDLIVVATSTPDWIQPATACAVQAQLGATRAAAYDLGAVCSGFLYALALTASTMRGSDQYGRALVIGAETYSRILDYRDRRTSVLFGDGAGAAVLAFVPGEDGILSSQLWADGTKVDLVKVPAGGSRRPPTAETVVRGEHFFAMDGRGVRAFLVERFPAAVHSALSLAGLDLEDIDLLVPHQANGVLLRQCAAVIGVPDRKVHLTIDRYGNTAAASIPITLDDAVVSGRLHAGHRVLLVAFGGGMTWGSVVMRWSGVRKEGRGEPAGQFHRSALR